MNLYKSLLQKGKDAIEAAQIPFKVKKEEKNLELKILNVEQDIATDELTIEQQKSASPVDWDKLIAAINKRDLKQRELSTLLKLQQEMFKDVTES